MSHRRYRIFRAFALISFLLCHVNLAMADLVLSAPPRESAEKGELYYGPLARSLSKILGETVVYQHPASWHDYTHKMRAGEYDIVFDGPHFAAWRMRHVNHAPVVRLPGHLGFVVMAKKLDEKTSSVRDLVGKEVCGLASPNLGTMAVFSVFDNPVIQPEIKIVKGGMHTVLKKFLEGECDYAVVRDKVYDNLPPFQKDGIKIIVRTTPLPNQTITINRKVEWAKRKKMADFIISSTGADAARELLSRFSNNDKFFIPAEEKEYDHLESLLEGVVYGW